MNGQREKILANLRADDFIGRSFELDTLLRHAHGDGSGNPALLVSGSPAVGVSECLRQIYDRLFDEQTEIVPFYFALRKSDRTARQAAVRFLQNFLQQTVAFRRADRTILSAERDVCELAEIAPPNDGYWIDRLIETCQSDSKLNDDAAFVRTCLSAPLRAFSNKTRVFVMIDDLHKAEFLTGEIDFTEELREIFARFETPFVFAGRRRFLSREFTDGFENFEIKPLSFNDAGLLAENLATRFNVKINEQTRDLIAVQFDGNPLFIRFLLQSASEKTVAPDSFQKVQQLYTDEIFGGRIAKFYGAIFEEIAAKTETQKLVLSLLFDALTIDREKSQIEAWQIRMNLSDTEFARVMRLLNTDELINVTTNLVEMMSENRPLSDYVTARFQLEIVQQNRALTVGETLTEYLKRAPRLMSEFYRRKSSVGLREILSVFANQEIPAALIDYSRFKDELKGAPNEEIFKALDAEEAEKTLLPQIVYTAHTVSFYPQFAQVTEKERSAVALGFIESRYTDDDETVWIAAEIDSKLEAKKDLAEFWCDRLEMVALVCNFRNYKIWLVAPEGFDAEAIELLRTRNAYGSSKKQVELLVEYLGAEGILGEKLKPNEYEMVVPMGDDTELIAVQTVEEIAKRHHFAPRAINQIKTALVEACINATEHSLSPDRKIYQKFTVEDDKIIITISNRGLRLADKQATEITPDEGRRGWGLKLIKNLMDEVKFEQTDDGTRISMVKYLKK